MEQPEGPHDRSTPAPRLPTCSACRSALPASPRTSVPLRARRPPVRRRWARRAAAYRSDARAPLPDGRVLRGVLRGRLEEGAASRDAHAARHGRLDGGERPWPRCACGRTRRSRPFATMTDKYKTPDPCTSCHADRSTARGLRTSSGARRGAPRGGPSDARRTLYGSATAHDEGAIVFGHPSVPQSRRSTSTIRPSPGPFTCPWAQA